MTGPDTCISVPAPATIRLIMATSEGLALDRDDIVAVRVGHRRGFVVFDASSPRSVARFDECGLEWRSAGGQVRQAIATAALVEVLQPGTIAIACSMSGNHPGHEEPGGDPAAFDDSEQEEPVPPEAAGRPASRPAWYKSLLGRWGLLSDDGRDCGPQIFLVREHGPREFRPIRDM